MTTDLLTRLSTAPKTLDRETAEEVMGVLGYVVPVRWFTEKETVEVLSDYTFIIGEIERRGWRIYVDTWLMSEPPRPGSEQYGVKVRCHFKKFHRWLHRALLLALVDAVMKDKP